MDKERSMPEALRGWSEGTKVMSKWIGGVEVRIVDLPVQKVAFSGFPLFVYVYDANGCHDEGTRIDEQGVLNLVMAAVPRVAIYKSTEIRITDRDDFLVYWIKDGQLVHDGFGDAEPSGG